jgi:hypothetical protein
MRLGRLMQLRTAYLLGLNGDQSRLRETSTSDHFGRPRRFRPAGYLRPGTRRVAAYCGDGRHAAASGAVSADVDAGSRGGSALDSVIEWSIAASSRLGYFAALYKRITTPWLPR